MSRGVDVLIVGAGPVGLAAAIELGTRGVSVMLVERNPRGGASPRAKTTNVRTRTHLRRWGIADELARASPLGIDYPNDVKFVTRLSGFELAHFRDAFNASPVRSPLYPEHAQWVPQYTLERTLMAHAQTLPTVRIEHGVSFVSAADAGDGVTVRLSSAQDEAQEVGCRFLIGADGARSAVREAIGSRMEGRYGLSRNYNVVFRAPGLAAAHPQGRAVMYWQSNADGGSLIGPMDRDDVWFFMPTGMREGETLDVEQAAAAIRLATGIDLPYEILSTDEWVASELLADRYRDGRVFLAGDACHLHPPFGGYGMNMGIGDAVDLGWKLAALIGGWGGSLLLESYEAERRPVHRAVMDEAIANHSMLGGQIWREGLEDDTPEGAALRHEVGHRILTAKAREFHSLRIVLGLGYDRSPIVMSDAVSIEPAPGTQDDLSAYLPSAAPGQLAPHFWMSDGRSLYDELGQGFTLLAGGAADDVDLERARDAAIELGIPLKIVRLDETPFERLYLKRLALVRPDQHVAWRGDTWDDAALAVASGLARAAVSEDAG